MREQWTLETKGKMLGLWSTTLIDRGISSNIELVDADYTRNNPYFVEKAVVGRENILEALKNMGFVGYGHYVNLITNGQLVTKRGLVGNIIEDIGWNKLTNLLPNKLRFVRKVI